MFAWAMRAGLAKENPAALVPRNSEVAKDRVLSSEELQLIWAATGTGTDHDRIVRLLMLTGCRRNEMGGLRWSEVDGSLITVPASRTKTSILHEVPLSALAFAQMPARSEGREAVFGEGHAGFSGWSRSKARLDARIARLRAPEAAAEGGAVPAYAIPAWSLHDFRRTLSTRLNDAGVDPHVVEALLGHAGAKRGVAGVYNRASYRAQKAEALETWAGLVSTIVGAA
jgi:integrase